LILVLATVLSYAINCFAYFSDRVTGTVDTTAGTLNLDITEFNVSQATGLKPGTGIAVDITLSNVGNKSADVLETLVLTSSKAMSETPEFELYPASDVIITNGVATLKDDAEPLSVRTINYTRTQITYKISEFILDGTGVGAEIEPGSLGSSKTAHYILFFRPGVSNDFQGVDLLLDYEAQAKQHRNTNSDTWEVVKSQTVDFAGDSSHPAVPAA